MPPLDHPAKESYALCGGTRSPSTRALIEHSASVIGTPASTIGQSTTAQRLGIGRPFDPAALAAARVDEENRLAGVFF
jgi:hypothetical protein